VYLVNVERGYKELKHIGLIYATKRLLVFSVPIRN